MSDIRHKRVYLKTGGYFDIVGENVAFVDANGSDVALTQAQQAFLAEVIRHMGATVSYDEVYKAYSGQDGYGKVAQTVAKVKSQIPDEPRGCIQSYRGHGYRLDLQRIKNIEEIDPYQSARNARKQGCETLLCRMCGDYYGFYLDPVLDPTGNTNVLGIYLHIENKGSVESPDIAASAVIGIRRSDVLLDDSLAEVFQDHTKPYRERFKAFADRLDVGDQRCFWGEGEVEECGNVVAIKLTTPMMSKWTIMMDVSRLRERMVLNPQREFRGGMGLLLALDKLSGTLCMRCGLARTRLRKPSLHLGDENIKSMLQISREAGWGPLAIEKALDNFWYSWIMNAGA